MNTTSFLIPSNRGADEISKTIGSIANTCVDSNCVEVLVKVDSLEEKQIYDDFFLRRYEFPVVVFLKNVTGYVNSFDSMNYLSRQSSGELLWGFADDLIIRTANWQQQFEEICQRYPDMLFAINHRKHAYSWAPVITKRWFNVVGYWANDIYGDTWIQHVAHHADRHIRVRDHIQIDHTHKRFHRISKTVRKKALKNIFKKSKVVAKNIRQLIHSFQTKDNL